MWNAGQSGTIALTNLGGLSSVQVGNVVGLTAIQELTNDFENWTVNSTLSPAGTPVISEVASVPSSNSAFISWTTDIASDSSVFYGTNADYSFSTNLSSLTSNHYVTLAGLTTNTDYQYYVASATNGLTGISWDYQVWTWGGPAIYFVSASQDVVMQAEVIGSATVTWFWGDGTNNAEATHQFASQGAYTNFVTVTPSAALIGFGAGCQDPGTNATALWSVSGLTNYAELQDIYFYVTGLTI